jgi:hypothetical protein
MIPGSFVKAWAHFVPFMNENSMETIIRKSHEIATIASR